MMERRKILLTGKDGQLGWELHRRLEQKHDVIAIGRDDIDLRNTPLFHGLLRRLPELALIINTAAYTNVDRAEWEPLATELVNIEVPAVLAAEADRRGIPIIHFSTDYVFDGKKWTTPYKETDRPNPLSVYGWSKLAGEQRVCDLCDKHLIFRISSLYGTRRRNFLTTMLKFMNSGESPRIVDDQIISPNWCPMIAEAVEHAVSQVLSDLRTEWGIYHLTGTGSTTWYEFARMIFTKISVIWKQPLITPQAVSTKKFGADAKRPACSIMSPNKFTHIFGYALPNWQTQFLHCVNQISATGIQ